MGPSHRFALNGMATTAARGFETPLGVVPVDHHWLDQVRDHPLFGVSDDAHEGEYCLETQLPLLQHVLGDFTIAPIICGRVSGEQVADLLDKLWGGPETVIVVSSDLSHYLDYQTCRALDSMTCAAIERLDPVELTPEQACGAAPVNGLLAAARRRGMRVETLDLRNSGDTAGPRDRVVGYGAWGFWDQDAALGAALRDKITLTDDLVDQTNFDTYEPLRLSDMPAVDVHIVKSNQSPTGVGEPGVPPIAPAVSNAIFAGTDKWLRSLPFDFELLKSGEKS